MQGAFEEEPLFAAPPNKLPAPTHLFEFDADEKTLAANLAKAPVRL